MSRIQLVLFASLLVIALTFILLNPQADLYLSNKIGEILLLPLRVSYRYIQYLETSQKKIEYLETEVSKLQIENQALRYQLEQYKVADTILTAHLRLLKANIIGRDPQNFNGFLYLDKGSTQGLNLNAPVVLENCIVGRIKSLAENTAIVETIENVDFAISAVDSRSGIYGIVKKRTSHYLEYIKSKDDVQIGDSIYTSGLSDIFPGGLLIGVVKNIKKKEDLFFKEVEIEPAISINALHYVYVIY
ncbi:MAG: rod shape-determining protein MreC [candidate division WOR-3 bacterium]